MLPFQPEEKLFSASAEETNQRSNTVVKVVA
jgi:hypothetical protein